MYELKNQLTKVTDKYIQIVNSSAKGKSDLESTSIKLKVFAENLTLLGKELNSEASKFADDNSISDLDSISKIVNDQLSRYSESCLQD